jgi:hypothetical protein
MDPPLDLPDFAHCRRLQPSQQRLDFTLLRLETPGGLEDFCADRDQALSD